MLKIKKRPNDMGMLIVVGGPGGSGSSTIAKMLSQYFGLHHVYGGSYMRQYANDYGFTSVKDFLEYNNSNDSQLVFDKAVDNRLIAASRWHDVLIDSKNFAGLAQMMQIPKTSTIWLEANLDIRVRRTLHKQKIINLKVDLSQYSKIYKNTEKELLKRYELDLERYKRVYSIDYDQPSKYNDIVIDTSPYTAGQTLNLVLKELSRYV